jgi:hypothetical protein
MFFTIFSLNFWSQIYARLPTSARHASPSRIIRCRPHPLPEAHVTSVVGARRVVFTRQRAFCSLARVTVTLRLLWPCMVGDGVYGARSARKVQPVTARVLHALQFLVKSTLSSLLAAYFGCFPALCLCIFLYLCHNLPFGSYFKLGFFIALWVEIIYL